MKGTCADPEAPWAVQRTLPRGLTPKSKDQYEGMGGEERVRDWLMRGAEGKTGDEKQEDEQMIVHAGIILRAFSFLSSL